MSASNEARALHIFIECVWMFHGCCCEPFETCCHSKVTKPKIPVTHQQWQQWQHICHVKIPLPVWKHQRALVLSVPDVVCNEHPMFNQMCVSKIAPVAHDCKRKSAKSWVVDFSVHVMQLLVKKGWNVFGWSKWKNRLLDHPLNVDANRHLQRAQGVQLQIPKQWAWSSCSMTTVCWCPIQGRLPVPRYPRLGTRE